MASVTSYTAARMQAIEDQAVVGGHVTGGNLILERHNGGTINAGSVVGPAGPTGPSGAVGGTTGAVDNAIIRANGTGGTTVQSSGITIDDSDRLTAPLMTVTTPPSVGTDVVNKTYSDKKGLGLISAPKYDAGGLVLPVNAYITVPNLSITFTPVVGRCYRFNFKISFAHTNATDLVMATAIFRTSELSKHMLWNGATASNPGAWNTTINASEILVIPPGWNVSTTFIVGAYANSAISLANFGFENTNPHSFSIEDVGIP